MGSEYPTKDGIWVPCIGSVDSQPLRHLASPIKTFLGDQFIHLTSLSAHQLSSSMSNAGVDWTFRGVKTLSLRKGDEIRRVKNDQRSKIQ